MKRPAAFLLLLLGLLLRSAFAIEVEPDPKNVIAPRLGGTWQSSPAIDRVLAGREVNEALTLRFDPDPKVLKTLSPSLKPLLAGKRIYLAGRLSIGDRPLVFLITEENGSPRLLCFKPDAQDLQKASYLYLMLAVARSRTADILFVGGVLPDSPFQAYERATQAAERTLSAETQRLLAAAIAGDDAAYPDFRALLATLALQPDWQLVATVVNQQLAEDPVFDQNNRCLILEEILRQHLAQIQLDVGPLIRLLSTPFFTNQQKASQALAVAARRPEIFGGKEHEAIKALIPLTASQRGRVVEPALEALRALSGNRVLARDPHGWAQWYTERYGEPLDLRDSVHELLALLQISQDEKGSARYTVDSGEPLSETELEAQLAKFQEIARKRRLVPRIVLRVSDELLASPTDLLTRETLGIRTLLGRLGLSHQMTLAPQSDRFFAAFEPGFP